MHDCHSPYIISFYGAFLSDPNICMCIEFMDKGSLDGIYKKIGAIDIEVVSKIALAVLEDARDLRRKRRRLGLERHLEEPGLAHVVPDAGGDEVCQL